MTNELLRQQKKTREHEGVFFKCKFRENPESGETEMCGVELSDNTSTSSPDYSEKYLSVLKNTTGSSNRDVAQRILSRAARGICSENGEERIQEVMTLLNALGPQSEIEAMLLSQFLALQDSGMQCLHDANHCSGTFYHRKDLSQLSVKLFRCANETLQALLKNRSGGKQQIQVIHVSGDGKAVIANEMSSGNRG